MWPHNITIIHREYSKKLEKDIFTKQIINGVYWYGNTAMIFNNLTLEQSKDINIIIPKKNVIDDLIVKEKDFIILGIIEEDITSLDDLKIYVNKITVKSIIKNDISCSLDNYVILGI